jgi:integrase
MEAFTAMSASFGWAVGVRKLDENPLRGLRGLLPRPPRGKERTVLEPAEIVELADATGHPMYQAMVLVLGCTGLRPGEMLALRVGDLHIKDEIPYVWVSRSAVVGTDGRMVMNEYPKTGQDRRVDLLEPARSAVIGHIEQRPYRLGDDDLIFTGPRTGGVFYGSYLRAIVVKASESCKFKRVVPYGLRHSYCVNSIRATGNIEYVAQQMGHKTVQTTLGIYNRHVTHAGRMRSARALEESFGLVSSLGSED